MQARRRRSLRLLVLLAGVGVFLLTLGFVEHQAGNTVLSGLEVRVVGASGVHFVDEESVRRTLLADGGLIGTPVRELDITAMEAKLRAMGSVAKADVYRTMDGVLHVKVEQRTPIARVINADGSGFYITDAGSTMPLSANYTARVPVFTGALQEPFVGRVVDLTALPDSLESRTRSAAMSRIAATLAADPTWSALFEQVVLDPQNGFELIPRVGMHRIRIGDGDAVDLRLEKLRDFYAQGITQADWRRYSIIDLRFGDQVVCTKRSAS